VIASCIFKRNVPRGEPILPNFPVGWLEARAIGRAALNDQYRPRLFSRGINGPRKPPLTITQGCHPCRAENDSELGVVMVARDAQTRKRAKNGCFCEIQDPAPDPPRTRQVQDTYETGTSHVPAPDRVRLQKSRVLMSHGRPIANREVPRCEVQPGPENEILLCHLRPPLLRCPAAAGFLSFSLA
jgi:hypothetical protein